MDFLLAILFILFVVLIGIIPFFLLYGLSDFTRFLLLNVFGYRKKVVKDNLLKSFPQKSEKEINTLIRCFYKNLSDVLIEGIKAFSMTKKQVKNRHKVLNPEVAQRFLEKGQSIIVLTAHYTNWEWGTMSGGLYFENKNIALYKPLNNKWVDRYVRRSRSKYGTELASIFKTIETFEKNKDSGVIFILAADQSPSKSNRAQWVDFLGRDTAFLYGPEKYARKYNLPVFYIDIQRKKRGFYELSFSLMTDKPASLPDGHITKMYANKLEEIIQSKPENWLWSHRRWKLHKPESDKKVIRS